MDKTVAIAKPIDYFFHMRNVDDILGAVVDDPALAAALIIAVDGEVVVEAAKGVTRAFDAPGSPTSPRGIPVDAATRFDLASITKIITAATVLSLLDERGADASMEVGEVLPEFAGTGMRRITIAQLLSHTAGFPAEWHDRSPDPGAVRFRAGARPIDPPGTAHRYSCVGYIWAGFAAEALGGASLDRLAEQYVLEPLGMRETGYRPSPEIRPRIAATEYQQEPPRGMVQGDVHDETAWALGGAVGNAGLFGTARDLLRLAEALRAAPGESPLPAAVVRAMSAPVAVPGEGYRQALGPRIDDEWMRGLRSPAVGHTGFTGTAVATEHGGLRSVVFLTNRVHPRRTSKEAIQTMRRRVTDAAAALGVHR